MAEKAEAGRRFLEPFLVANSGIANHYVLTVDKRPIGEVSGETVSILLIDAIGFLNKGSGGTMNKKTLDKILAKRGITTNEVIDGWVIYQRRLNELAMDSYIDGDKRIEYSEAAKQQRREEARRVTEEYFAKNGVIIHYGSEKALCMMEALVSPEKNGITQSPPPFEGATLERMRKYKLQPLSK